MSQVTNAGASVNSMEGMMPEAAKPQPDPEDNVAEKAVWDLISELDSIQQRRLLLDQERTQAIETASYILSYFSYSDDEAKSLFTELYWGLEDVQVEVLAALFDRSYRAKRDGITPSPIETGIHCSFCGAEFIAHSRYALRETLSDDRKNAQNECRDCKKSRLAISDQEASGRWKKSEERRRYLQRMPYDLYLKTDEWQATRTAALKRARYACQICKRNDMVLDVHHNTYERRGSELASYLVVMCRDCHSKHHNKLPKEKAP
jgi:5-methylcytosine-specific restriction endonuclease McrA